MMDMMRTCWDWMMSLGWIGMVLGVALFISLILLVVVLVRRVSRGSR